MTKKSKSEQLGMSYGKASNILRKRILFDLIKKMNCNVCFQCKNIIKNENEMSIEHKVPWLHSDNPSQLFFDLENISFSHRKCNSAAARKKEMSKHGTNHRYNKYRCRCEACRKVAVVNVKNYRKRRKERTGKDR